jgi:hypothetical protein
MVRLLPAGLRSLQGRQQLQELIGFVKTTRDNLDWGPGGPPPLLVKIAPDLTDADKADIAAVVAATKIDGLVVGNTTVSRPGKRLAATSYACCSLSYDPLGCSPAFFSRPASSSPSRLVGVGLDMEPTQRALHATSGRTQHATAYTVCHSMPFPGVLARHLTVNTCTTATVDRGGEQPSKWQ